MVPASMSFLRCKPESSPRGGGGALVAMRAEFDAPVDDAEIEPVDEAAIAALLAKIAQARPRPFAIDDGAVDEALGHGAVPQTRAKNQCEMTARKPTRPATAMIAQRTPRACKRIACISSTLPHMRASYSSMCETFCSSTARRSLGERLMGASRSCARSFRASGRPRKP